MSNENQQFLQTADIFFGIRSHVLGATDYKMMVVTQGCSHNKCPRCMSPHTWDSSQGSSIDIESIIDMAKQQSIEPTGLVISGGEPLDQYQEILELMAQFKLAFSDAEVILFTAYLKSKIEKQFSEVLACADVIVSGPYVQQLPGYSLLGSSNQQVLFLSERARELYHDWGSWPQQTQVLVKNKQVTMIGLQGTKNINWKHSDIDKIIVKQL